MLNWISSFLRRVDGRIGYVYASTNEAGPMQDARAGAIVRLPDRGPPWIVVDFDLAKVVAARWPGRLWRVRVIEAANARDQQQSGGPPNEQATYVRAISVEILSEESADLLFGPHGENLIALFDEAARLTRETAQRLSLSRHADAAAAYDRALRRWAQAAHVATPGDDLDGVLKIGGGWPVNGALAVLHRIVWDRAHAIDGDSASTESDNAMYLVEPWSTAGQVMGDAALALGAPQFLDDADRAALLSGHARVFSAST